MTAAVVLAAGHSDRMGSNKLALPMGSGTVVGRVVEIALAACDSVIVVIALHDQATRTAVERTAAALGTQERVQVTEGVPYDPGMFISI
ncbi:MAG TPA: NTP transferase domain-containing protein, partial [Clostridia bacterium]|nr:NTP transferase domain-containing protein [Clostridia bacterium]